jgi:hypothetical protein
MKTITELAYDAIVQLNLIPKENVGINSVIHENWDGVARIVVEEEMTNPEDESQFGTLTWITRFNVNCLCRDRTKAEALGKTVANTVYATFMEYELARTCEILSIMRKESTTTNIKGREEFQSLQYFEVLHKIRPQSVQSIEPV